MQSSRTWRNQLRRARHRGSHSAPTDLRYKQRWARAFFLDSPVALFEKYLVFALPIHYSSVAYLWQEAFHKRVINPSGSYIIVQYLVDRYIFVCRSSRDSRRHCSVWQPKPYPTYTQICIFSAKKSSICYIITFNHLSAHFVYLQLFKMVNLHHRVLTPNGPKPCRLL